MYLIDTNVLSAGAPSKSTVSVDLVHWMERASARLFLSVVTATEVESGIQKASREGATTKAKMLSEWWFAIEHLYGARILSIDIKVAHAIGKLLDESRSMGHSPGWADIAIAGTALTHDLTVLTRNVRHFEPLGVRVVDPFIQCPP